MMAVLEKVKHFLSRPKASLPGSTIPFTAPTLRSMTTAKAPNVLEELDHPEPCPSVLRHGSVAILGNQIFVTDPGQDGSFATVKIPSDSRLKVIVDGKPCVGDIPVYEGLAIHIELPAVSARRVFSSRVSKDKLQVVVRATITPGEEFQLRDWEPGIHACCEIEVKRTLPEPSMEQELELYLVEKGYKGQVDTESLVQLVQATQMMSAPL